MKLKSFGAAVFRPLVMPLLVVFALGVLVTSCSKDAELLDAVPSDVENVGLVRMKSVLEQSGFKFGADGVSADSSVAAEGRFRELVDLTGAMNASGVCDVDRMAWVKDHDGTFYLTVLVADGDKFVEATAGEISWADAKDGFKQGEWGGFTALTGDGRFWLTDAKEAVRSVKALQKRASKASVTLLTGVCEMLEGEGLLNMALRRDVRKGGAKTSVSEIQESLWITLNCNVSYNMLTASSVTMQGDGKVVAADGLQPINPAVLGYIPASCNIACAVGLTPDFDWSVITQAVGTFGGFQARGMLSAVTPYLMSINGTVMFAAGPANDQAYSDVDPGNWQFVLMARLPQEKINEIMNMVRSSMFMAGISPRMTDDGLMMVPQYGMNLYLGNVDGYFGLSNMPFDCTRQNELAPLFTGKDGALSVEIPSLRSLNPSAPAFGLKLTGQTGEGSTTASLALTGVQQPILQAILSALL